MNDEDFLMPRTLDDPPLFFVWEFDSASFFIFWVLMGLVINMFVLGLFMAIIFARGYARLKEEGGKGLIIRVIYWFTPSDWCSTRYQAWKREFIGG